MIKHTSRFEKTCPVLRKTGPMLKNTRPVMRKDRPVMRKHNAGLRRRRRHGVWRRHGRHGANRGGLRRYGNKPHYPIPIASKPLCARKSEVDKTIGHPSNLPATQQPSNKPATNQQPTSNQEDLDFTGLHSGLHRTSLRTSLDSHS